MHKITVALVGLGFGSCFAEIYRGHPDAGTLTLSDAEPSAWAALPARRPRPAPYSASTKSWPVPTFMRSI